MFQEPSVRIQQVSELYHNELSDLLVKDIQNPNLKRTIITQVLFTPDLRLAKVYFHIDGDEHMVDTALKGFVRSKGFIKKEMAKRVNLKYSPDIRFYYDNTFEERDRIERLFHEIGNDNGESEDN